MDLSPYKWKNRLLFVFAPSLSNKEYEEQLSSLQGLEAEFEDRDLLLGKFLEKEAAEFDGTPVAAEDATRLREKFSAEPGDLTVLLVGKDGTEKFRSEEPVAAEEIFRRIDAMPMRRREMRG